MHIKTTKLIIIYILKQEISSAYKTPSATSYWENCSRGGTEICLLFGVLHLATLALFHYGRGCVIIFARSTSSPLACTCWCCAQRLPPAAYSRANERAPEGTGAHKYAQIPFSNNNFSISASHARNTKFPSFPPRVHFPRTRAGWKQNKQPAAAAVLQSRTAVFEPINQQAARFHYSSIWLITAAARKHSVPPRTNSLAACMRNEMGRAWLKSTARALFLFAPALYALSGMTAVMTPAR